MAGKMAESVTSEALSNTEPAANETSGAMESGANAQAAISEDQRAVGDLGSKSLPRKEDIQEEMKDISKELQELKLLEESKKALGEEAKGKKRIKKKRRRKRKLNKNRDDDKTQLPRSVKKFIDRMLARSKKKKSERSDLSDFSDDDTDTDDADHVKKSPVPYHLLTVPKSKIRLLTPTLDIESGSLNILHSYRGSMFGSVRAPVYRQFPNNHFQAAGRLKMAYSDARLPAHRAMEKLAESLFDQKDGKRPEAAGNGVFNLYTDRMLVQSTKDSRSSVTEGGYHSYLPFVIQMERGADSGRFQQTKSSPSQANDSSPPASSGSRVTTAVLSLASLTVSESGIVTQSACSDYSRQSNLMKIRQKTSVPRITVNKPIERSFGVRRTRRAESEKSFVKMVPIQKHLLHPGFAIADSPPSADHLIHALLGPPEVKRSNLKEDYIVRKVY